MNYLNHKIVYLTLALLIICALNIGITENFEMFPVRGDYCEKQNLKKAYGPTMCVLKTVHLIFIRIADVLNLVQVIVKNVIQMLKSPLLH